MPDDEPLDDARAVATAAAAAAARVVETVAREARDQAAQHRVLQERHQDQLRARQALAGLTGTMVEGRLATGYDSAPQRVERDRSRESAGVPVAAREVRATADLMNGANPSHAAVQPQSVGSIDPPKRQHRQVTRGR